MKPTGHVRKIALAFLLMADCTAHAATFAMPEPGFDTMVMIQRRPLNPMHVYTYHVEGLEKGGGLYVKSLAEWWPEATDRHGEGVIHDCHVSYDGSQVGNAR